MIYIVGTSRGLGRALCDNYRKLRPEVPVIGLNRPNYDLASGSLKAFLKCDFDIYILNAHCEWSQVDLMYELFEHNQNRRCQIVSIGSVSADGDRKKITKYAIQKKALDAACTQLQLIDSACTITNIKLGRLNTDLVSHIDAPKMNLEDVAKTIINVIEINNSEYYVKTITIDIK